ncbi:hypothetical protein PIB30_055976 [Stylosanthes scabra]|uniref:Uncharacterized protein n=1 Tax=Stylosanthes scabra TaxID=79078 RepID=A0ABU6UMS0_9FABA|nr:hypothetical protein [Stylosanthes scabra]
MVIAKLQIDHNSKRYDRQTVGQTMPPRIIPVQKPDCYGEVKAQDDAPDPRLNVATRNALVTSEITCGFWGERYRRILGGIYWQNLAFREGGKTLPAEFIIPP